MRRLNVRLVVWLFSGVLVFFICAFALHARQVRVSGAQLIKKAQEAEDKGEIGRAIKHYRVLLGQEKDAEKAGKVASLYKQRLRDQDLIPQDHFKDYTELQELVRHFPEVDAAREVAIDHALYLGQFLDQGARLTDAMQMIDDLFQRSEERAPEMELKYAQCLSRMRDYEKSSTLLKTLVGFDDQTKKFRAGARGAKLVNAYMELIKVLETQKSAGNQKVIDKMLEQVVAANPESYESYLRRGEYYMASRTSGELAEADLNKAYELNPDHVETAIGAARIALQNSRWERADEVLTKAIEKHPKNDVLFALWSLSANEQDQSSEAVARCKKGLEHSPRSIILYSQLANCKMAAREYDGVLEIAAKLKELGALPGRWIMVEAQLAYHQQDWLKAAKKYEELRIRDFREISIDRTDATVRVELPLTHCYEVLQQPDKVIVAARRVIEVDPKNVPARLALERAQKLTRQVGAQPSVELDELGEISAEYQRSAAFHRALAEQMAKPNVADRDWTKADELAKQLEADPKITDVGRALVNVTMLIAKEQREAARKQLVQLAKQYPKEPAPWLTLIRMSAEDGDISTLERLVDTAENRVGKRAVFRSARLTVLARKGVEALKAGLPAIEDGIDEMPKNERAALLKAIGYSYFQVQDYANGMRCWKAAAELNPNDLRQRQQIFDVAQAQDDLDGMNAAIDSIKAAAGVDGDLAKDLIFYCEAGRMLWQIDKKQLPKSAFDDVRRRVEEARRLRPEWHELFKLQAHLNEMEGNIPEAIENYKLALDKGTNNGNVSRRLLQLLFARGRYEEAGATLPHILPRLAIGDPLEKLVAETLYRTGGADGPEQALKFVSRRTELAKTPQNLAWHGLYLQRAGKMEEAERVFREAVEQVPTFAQGWILLATNLQEQRQLNEAEAVVEQAKAALTGDDAAFAFAQMHEVIGDAAAAERYYLQAAKDSPADANIVQSLAQFYLRAGRVADGEQVFTQLLKSDNEDSAALKPGIRRTLAQIIASKRGYANVKRAVELLDQNAVNGQLSHEDILLQARLWSERPEPALKNRAASIYEEVQKTQTLTPEQQLALALLQESTGQWKKAREQMQNLLARDGKNPLFLAGFARMLLEHEDRADEVGGILDQIDQIDPEYPATKELRAWHLVKQGQTQDAKQLLGNLVPRPLRPNQVAELARVALLYEQLGFQDDAGQLLREYVELEPRAALELGRFLGRHGDLDEAFALIDQARSSQPAAVVIQVGLSTLRMRSEEARAEHYERVESWINEGSESEDEDALKNREIQLAQLWEMQGQMEAVVKNYREFLKRDDANEVEKAVVKNNLSFAIALAPNLAQDSQEAVRLANEAINELGETSDLLDTRGIALCAAGDNNAARTDLQVALRDAPSALKYAHLAWVEFKANDLAAARDAYRRASELRFNPRMTSPLERQMLSKLKTDLGL